MFRPTGLQKCISSNRFSLLEREVATSVTDAKAEEAKELLEKIKEFIYVDNDTIPHIVVG